MSPSVNVEQIVPRSTPPQGARVKVEYEAEYDYPVSAGRHMVSDATGKGTVVPADARLIVLELPAPPEPPVGTVVRSALRATLYRHYGGHGSNGWHALRECSVYRPAEKGLSWPEVYRQLGGEAGDVHQVVRNPVSKDTPDLANEPLKLTLRNPWGNSSLVVGQEVGSGRITFTEGTGVTFGITYQDARKLAAALLKAVGVSA